MASVVASTWKSATDTGGVAVEPPVGCVVDGVVEGVDGCGSHDCAVVCASTRANTAVFHIAG
jgi:hypothetical protein